MDNAKQLIVNFFVLKGVDIIGTMIILGAGFFLSQWTGNVVQKWLQKQDLEPPVRGLMVKFVRLIVMAFVVVVAMQQLGVPIAPMIAGIGVAGVGIGLAMQGLLGNMVAGLMIIFTKPFRVGEYVEIAGVNGMVAGIELLSTTLTHLDLSRVVIPNRKIMGEILHNYGTIRQLDLRVGVAYSSDLGLVFRTLDGILRADARVLKDPAPVVGVSAMADSSIEVSIKPWVKVPDYVPTGGELNRAVIEAFRKEQVEIPFPQREVRLLNAAAIDPVK